jgi:predicted ATP-dependent endonuclease of OLD family
MRLQKARVQNYRSVRDTGWFDLEKMKTIFVGSNEAGKTAVLQALQQLNAPPDVAKFDPLRDYPRSSFNDITKGKVDPATTPVVEGHFSLDKAEKDQIPEAFKECTYYRLTRLDNSKIHNLNGGPATPTYVEVKKDLSRLAAHIDAHVPPPAEGAAKSPSPSEGLATITAKWVDSSPLRADNAKALRGWLEQNYKFIDEKDANEEARYDKLVASTKLDETRDAVLALLNQKLPVFVLFNNYFRVRPLIHLDHLAKRLETKVLDDDQYDYGNQCLLKLLGFSARELSTLGKAAEPAAGNAVALKAYRDQLDRRSYQLNAASVRLTNEVRAIWNPNLEHNEANKLRVQADGQYLKVVVEDDLGVEIELDQRSEGFQWLVSFFVVFFAEAQDKHENAILLLDEPGLSLHGLKQHEFRITLSRLSESNQVIYTTHSPFLVGPDELDIVRVVEMVDRRVGTKVHTTVTADDPASFLPLQEALGYDLAQSLFSQQRNLVLEGLTDLWYIDGTAQLLRESQLVDLNEKIALIPAQSAGKVVYFATILHANKLKVAALLDSDTAGDQAARQDTLVNMLGNKNILRTKDWYVGAVTNPEVEDLLRGTLIKVAKDQLSWDVEATAVAQPKRPIVDIFTASIKDFSKYRLAKAFLRWTRTAKSSDLLPEEISQWTNLINIVNKVMK